MSSTAIPRYTRCNEVPRFAVWTFAAAAALAFAAPAISDADDTIYTASYFSGVIEKFTTGGVGSVFASTGFNSPGGLAFDSTGNLLSSWAQPSAIFKFHPDGSSSLFANTSGSTAQSLAFDSAGNLYAAFPNLFTIEKFTPGGVGSVFAKYSGTHPQELAIDSSDNVYVSSDDNAITKFTPRGVGTFFASTGLYNAIFGLAFDSAGNLYAAAPTGYPSQSVNLIEKFAPSGIGSVFATTGVYQPLSPAFDSAGNLYVAYSSYSTIEKFTPDGAGSVFANIFDPVCIAINSVPEPSTLALSAGGLAILAATALRNRFQFVTNQSLTESFFVTLRIVLRASQAATGAIAHSRKENEVFQKPAEIVSQIQTFGA